MTSVLAVFAISGSSLFIGTSPANAAAGYYPQGPQLNVPISNITAAGWTLCWSGLYGGTDSLANIENSCTGKYLLEAAGEVNSTNYLLVAAGERTAVLAPTASNQTTFNNGTYWYYGKNDFLSMGFSPTNQIFQNSADCYYNGEINCSFESTYVEGLDPTANYRMSWHIDGSDQTIFGGWRIGHINWLNSSSSYVRAIYQSNMPADFVVAKLDKVTFEDDGSGSGGKLIWTGKYIDSVLFSGNSEIYPGAFNFGAFTSSWNGRVTNLKPNTSYTVTINAISSYGLGESKTITFKTGSGKTEVKDLNYWTNWLNENTYYSNESANMITLLRKFNELTVRDHAAYVQLPISRVSSVNAESLTPSACSVATNGYVRSLTSQTCTISYSVTGSSNTTATLIKDIVFKTHN